jgi:SAM-dependent methyltransferase
MRAIHGNLTDPDDPKPAALASLPPFDVAVVGLGFHHFEDPTLAAQRLAERLKPGGVLVIVDFLPHDAVLVGPATQAVKHHGFDREKMRGIFEAAGAGKDFAMEEMGRGIVFHRGPQASEAHEHGGHGHGGHGHGGHGHGEHGHGHGHAHGHEASEHRSGEPMRRHVFIARGTKA